MEEDDHRSNVYRLLLKSGFIRVGERNNTLHFECTNQTADRRKQFMIDFAEQYSKGCEIEPRKV